jgi:thioesterase domain-containing protein
LRSEFTLEQLAATYLKQIRHVQSSGPYFIVGWSFGAIVAYEIAKQIKKDKKNNVKVAILDESTYLNYQELKQKIENLEEIVNYNGNKLGLLPYLESSSACMLTHSMILEKYKICGKIDEICLFKSKELEEYHIKNNLASDHFGWQKYCSSIKSFTVGGNHYSILTEPHVDTIARHLMLEIVNGNNSLC